MDVRVDAAETHSSIPCHFNLAGMPSQDAEEGSSDATDAATPDQRGKDEGEQPSAAPGEAGGVEVEDAPFIDLFAAEAPATGLERTLRHCAILSLLAFMAIWGTLAREGLVALNTYDGMSVDPTIWAQAVGCLVMGWAVGNRKALETWYPPAYIAVGTGFCGSLTTFSSWMLHVFQAFGNQQHYNRHGLHNVMDALTQTAVTLGMSLAAVAAGMSLASRLPLDPLLRLLERHTTHKRLQRRTGIPVTRSLQSSPYMSGPDTACILLGLLFWAASAVLCATYPSFRQVTYSLVLAPPGAILRWYLSPLNSSARSLRAPYWPLGTLAANLTATAVLAAVFVAQRVGRVPGSGGGGASTIDGCHALYGVQEGFCACLSTISTFAVELRNLKPTRRAVGYAVGSWVAGILICVLLIGSPWWSIGMDGSCVGVTL